MGSKVLYFLIFISLNLFALSNSAKIDIIKIKVQEKVKKGEFSSIIPLIDEWKSIDKNIPKSLAFFEGKAYYSKKNKSYKDYISSYENLEKYINENGKKGRYYSEALKIIIEIEDNYKEALEKQKYYSKYKNRVVVDKENSLMWQDDFDVVATYRSIKENIKYCKNLKLAGFSDWRVPNANEIFTTVDHPHRPPIKSEFKNIKTLKNNYPYFYINENNINKNYFLNSVEGLIDSTYKNNFYVRCVRTYK